MGVEYPFQNSEILQKTIDLQINKYGTFGRKINTSKQQIYINNLYNGKLNYRIGNYCVDILLDSNVICEYDGLGHNMMVKLGKLTEEEFVEKEKERSNYLQKLGYKEFSYYR